MFASMLVEGRYLEDPHFNTILDVASDHGTGAIVYSEFVNACVQARYPSMKRVLSTTREILDADELNKEPGLYDLAVFNYSLNKDNGFLESVEDASCLEVVANELRNPRCPIARSIAFTTVVIGWKDARRAAPDVGTDRGAEAACGIEARTARQNALTVHDFASFSIRSVYVLAVVSYTAPSFWHVWPGALQHPDQIHQLLAGMHLQLGIDILAVMAHGIFRHREGFGDIGLAAPSAE